MKKQKPNDAFELKTAELELWSYSPTIGTAWVDSLDEVDDDLAECARDEGGCGGLDVSDIDGELKINGKWVDIDFKQICRVKDGIANNWERFHYRIGIYSIDIDKADCSTTFSFAGDFDPKKLTLYYKTAIGPGYCEYPEIATIDLLVRVEYDGVELELDYGEEQNNKGCVFTVFNEGQYAEYYHGCNVLSLTWKKFPECSCIDFLNWDDWVEDEWLYYEHKLALNDESINEEFNDEWCLAIDNDYFDQIEFLSYACKRNVCWAFLISWGEWGFVIRDDPTLADNPDFVLKLASQCNAVFQDFGGYSRCVLLAKQPQFADKFSLEELGDPNGKCWLNYDSDDYEDAWELLIEAQPEFAKYRKG